MKMNIFVFSICINDGYYQNMEPRVPNNEHLLLVVIYFINDYDVYKNNLQS